MHLSVKSDGNIFIQLQLIDIFRNAIWRRPPSWIFIISEVGTFRHDCIVCFLSIVRNLVKISRIIAENDPYFVFDVRLLTSCELTSGSIFGQVGTFVRSCWIFVVNSAQISLSREI